MVWFDLSLRFQPCEAIISGEKTEFIPPCVATCSGEKLDPIRPCSAGFDGLVKE